MRCIWIFGRHFGGGSIVQMYVFDSLFCSSCILKFWNGFWLEIITNKITEASWCKFSCPLDWTTKLPFSPLPQAITCVFVFVLFFFSALPANTTHISSLTDSLSCIVWKKVNIFCSWFSFVSHNGLRERGTYMYS